MALWLLVRRRRARSPEAQLKAASHGLLENFLIPDGDGGEIHLDYAVLGSDSIMVLDLRDIEGHVFGSNAMQDWTVIADQRRFTFSNPQPALYDRVAAVKRLLPDVPVQGMIVFGARADFSKGRPGHVMMFDELLTELRNAKREQPLSPLLADAWANLQREAVAAQVGQLMRG
ncbi:MAG TPA: NERD domain-containing protein [Chromatiales bacterium]|nr:NERD domain-containing protein [Chromatiales bacterium]